MSEPTEEKGKRKWPSGMTFVMYCGGVSLLLLTAYVIFSKKDFTVDAHKGTLSTINAGVNPQPITTEAAEQKSADLKQQFEQVKTQTASMAGQSPETQNDGGNSTLQSFAGTWTGQGSSYIIEQYGSTLLFAEMTDGNMSAYGTGAANGNQADLTVMTLIGELQLHLSYDGSQITVTSVGGQFLLTRM